MNIKKAIIIGTLCAMGASLTAYAIKKGIDIKPKTITAVNADSLYTQKNAITTESLTDGWQYNVEPSDTDTGMQTFWTNPVEKTETKPTNLTNTTWTFKNRLELNIELGQKITYYVNFTIKDSFPNTHWNRIEYQYSAENGNKTLAYRSEEENVVLVWRNNTWFNNNHKTITITGGNDVTNENLINFLFDNQEYNHRFLANKRHETYSSSYLGIEYVMMSQKLYSAEKIKNETIFFIKLQSTGITRELYLENAVFYTTIPNMEFNGTYATYNAQFKMAKMTSMNVTEASNLWEQKGSFLKKYNSIQNKTNIYSVDAYVSGNTMNQQQNITYTNETGTAGTATFGHATASSVNTSMWTIHQNTDIYTQGRANYVVVYFNCEVSNFGTSISEQDHPNWYKYLYQYVGVTTQFKGYAVASMPVAPPDIENGNFMSLTGFILNILTLPFTFLSQAFNLTLWANTPWAFNIKSAIFVMIGIMTFIFIIKLFTRGFDSLGNYTGSISKNRLNRSQAKLNKEKAKLAKRTDPNTKTRINKKE